MADRSGDQTGRSLVDDLYLDEYIKEVRLKPDLFSYWEESEQLFIKEVF
jgi:hypothetical protein